MALWAAFWPFHRTRADEDAARLLVTVTQLARQPAFFGEGRVSDTLEGRLELMTLHASLALMRLQNEPGAQPLAQAFADQLFRQFDAGLREAAVGDLTVPKRMRKIASGFYGRLEIYAQALQAADATALTEAVARNVLKAPTHPFAPALANYMSDCAVRQKKASLESLFRLDGWAQALA